MSNQRIQPRTSGLFRGWNLSLPGALLAATLLSSSSHAMLGGGMGFGGGNGDSVGSLPSEHDAGPGVGQHGVFDPTVEQFRLVLVGDGAKLRALVPQEPEFGPSGSGQYHWEPLGTDGLVRVTFSGDVSLALDRALLESSFVAVQLELGPVFGGGALTVQAGNTVTRTAAVAGTLPVHLQQLATGPGQLLDAGVELRATAPNGKDRGLVMSGAPDGKRVVLKLQD
jgi:hypothetical protein